VAAAGGEYEAVQIVLSPLRDCELLSAGIEVSRQPRNSSRIQTEIHEVTYLKVEHPTDSSCSPGWYPDPLPVLETPLHLQNGVNQPLWITFQVPCGVRAGNYKCRLVLKTSLGSARVPITLRVYDFDLPEETHLRSALGLSSGEINRYQNLKRPADQQAVFEKYLENFANHRISPYSFYDYAQIAVSFRGEGATKPAVVDFSKFDRAAEKWLPRFTTFQLPLIGMGGGTFHSRHLGELEGFAEGTPEHARLFKDYLGKVEDHLKSRGWLNKAFTYWFDEPDPKDYEFVIDGMKRIKDAAPGIRRMLTEQPEPVFDGHVEIFCALTPEWTPGRVAACTAAGQEVWWYICCVPKSPYLTEFIDHPGNELRLWPWQSWQYGVSGILIWATTWWTSPAAFPPLNSKTLGLIP
jgi:hypothetical protein